MYQSLENTAIRFEFDPSSAAWRLVSTSQADTSVEAISVGCRFLEGASAQSWDGRLRIDRVDRTAGVDDLQGDYVGLSVQGKAEGQPLAVHLEFKLLLQAPLLLWQVELTNQASSTIYLDRISLFATGQNLPNNDLASSVKSTSSGEQSITLRGKTPDSWYMNGWQSWSFAGTLPRGVKLLTGTRLGSATAPMYLNPTSEKPEAGGRFISELYGIAGSLPVNRGVLVGMLSEQRAFGSLEATFSTDSSRIVLFNRLEQLALQPGASFRTERAAFQFVDLADPEGELPYLQATARENQVVLDKAPPVGWSSWYYFFEKVTQQDILRNAAWIGRHVDEVPLELVQIDDGFQKNLGDWLDRNEKFPSGHSVIVDEISQVGARAGLWLAPFSAVPGADIVADHPDWILRRKGRPVRAGYNWGTFFLALDVTHPGVMDYVQRVVKTAVEEWGYRYLKLDFLYAACLKGDRWDQSQTGAETLRNALSLIRRAAGPKVYLAGCGCPLGPAIGIVDSMRIGPDVAPRWLPAFHGIEFFFKREPSLPSLRNSLQNTLARAPLDGTWWHNDPDCLMLRQDETRLTEAETQLMVSTAALTGGPLLISDDLTGLEPDRVDWAGRLLPSLQAEVKVLDRLRTTRCEQLLVNCSGPLGDWQLVALINWSDEMKVIEFEPAHAGIAGGRVEAVDYWREQVHSFSGNRWLVEVPAHGVRLFQIHPDQSEQVCWLGDTLHISGGSVVKVWRVRDNSIEAELDLGRRGSGSAWLKLPGTVRVAKFNGRPISVKEIGSEIIRLELLEVSRGNLTIEWH